MPKYIVDVAREIEGYEVTEVEIETDLDPTSKEFQNLVFDMAETATDWVLDDGSIGISWANTYSIEAVFRVDEDNPNRYLFRGF